MKNFNVFNGTKACVTFYLISLIFNDFFNLIKHTIIVINISRFKLANKAQLFIIFNVSSTLIIISGFVVSFGNYGLIDSMFLQNY